MNPKDLAKPENLDNIQVYIDFVNKNLEPLAEHLKVSIDWLWDILVKQAQVEAIVYLIAVLALFLKSAILLIIAFKASKTATFAKAGYHRSMYKNEKTGEEHDYLHEIPDKERKGYTLVKPAKTNRNGYITYWFGLSGVAVAAIATIVLSVTLPIIVTGLVNPEYRAIEKIVDFAKPAVSNQTDKKGN